MKLFYSLAFLLGADNWKITPTAKEIINSLQEFNKDEDVVLDLGCGDGGDSITLAQKGWQVIGVDYIQLAVRNAKRGAVKVGVAEKVKFHVGDVTNINDLGLPPISFAYDIGCFHLLPKEQFIDYIEGMANLLRKDGLFLLKAFEPRRQGRRKVGFSEEMISDLFSPYFAIENTSCNSYWRFPAKWYWMRKN